MNKICTSVEQSKQLIELGIDINTADMCYRIVAYNPNDTHAYVYQQYCFVGTLESDIPAWSLATLLGIIPDVSLNAFKDGRNWNAMVQHDGKMIYVDKDNPVDACVELIIKLKELKML